MIEFRSAPLYGGAMAVDIPANYQHASTLRQVPDNQEVFLSPTTLTNIIIEINERVEQQAQPFSTPNAAQEGEPVLTTVANDVAASLYHLYDICDANGDKYEVLDPPRAVRLPKVDAPAYISQALIHTDTPTDGPNTTQTAISTREMSSLAVSQQPRTRKTTTTCHFLLVRLEPVQADLLVQVIVPHREFDDSATSGEIAMEESFAHDVMDQMTRSLEIRDYGLFGS
ncbi:hypothetical protein AJ80_01722 [Polytolypa hystricis UAMH7299]|uniref:Mog1p/PsbP-like protein n=1 Tax=Polytolypa hystricis (strain UAMH7299) TaxID=1447883 RepID=A0A2B7Z043_POLH7|nr:hypothetical protein AJ80_01722 [Polytolypa hystricis UAMH7299]